MATYAETTKAPTLTPPQLDEAPAAFGLSPLQGSALRGTAGGRWCAVMHGREMTQRFPDATWSARDHWLVY